MSEKNKNELDPRNLGTPGPMRPRQNLISLLILVATIGFVLFNYVLPNSQAPQPDDLSTNDFVSAVREDRVESVTFKTEDASLAGKYWRDSASRGDSSKAVAFKSFYVGTDSLQDLMGQHTGTKFSIDTSSNEIWETVAISVIPTLVVVAALVYFMGQMNNANGKQMGFGRAKGARTSEETRPKVKFSDVAGIDEAVEELKEVRDFLKEPERYLKMGAKIPHGVLLVGPPGTGKTLLAKAVAGEAGVPFFSISGSDFVEMFVGVGASSIVFIDEIDAVGRQRGAGLGGGHDEREQTLNQLLVEMDGFADTSAVILIAATNRPDILDPALLRPGRFDRQVTVDRPDVKGRERILSVHAQNKPLDDEVSFDKIAKLTPGFTGADLSNLMNESALLAARRRQERITMEDVEEAMERVIAGPEKKGRVMTERERVTIAYHESGHALVGHVLENSDPVHKISIISRGRALGYTLQLPEEDHFLETRDGMLDQIAVLLGGRTAEELFCEDITTGASNDLERATKIAREMVTRFGMSDDLGAQVFGEAQHEVFLGRDYANHSDLSAETSKRIDDEVERIMREAHDRARKVLSERRDQMETMAKVLLARETVEGDIVDALLDGRWDAYVAEHPEADPANAPEADADADAAADAEPTAPEADAAEKSDAVADDASADDAAPEAATAGTDDGKTD